MSKITSIRIKEMFGIKEFEASDKNIELLGGNGTGKTSVLDAIRFGLENDSERDYIIKQGSSEGEIIIETDTGISINRKERTNKAPYKSIREGGKEVQSPEKFVRNLFTTLQLNPVEFLAMTKNEQNRIVLDLIDFQWDMKWIEEQFGEIVPEVNWEQNILCVLNDIQDKEGYYFKRREYYNREARNKKAFVADIVKDLPEGYSADFWDKFDLGAVYKQIETIQRDNAQIEKAQAVIANRDNKVRGLKGELEIALSAIYKENKNTEENNKDEIAKLSARMNELQKENQGLIQKTADANALETAKFKTNVAEFEAEVKQYEQYEGKALRDYSELSQEAVNAEKMKKHINEYNRMLGYQAEIKDFDEKSEALTTKIEKARSLPAEILETSNIPVEGLTVVDGLPLINGLPISNLSEGEKLNLCVEIATQNPNALNILLIDGVEKLQKENRETLYGKLKDKGVQFISTRTTDDSELTVIEL